ncbi:FUSC family protein [Klebsiella pneumoniae subsp. pneumoniae]|nr:FUSC family protein [Klebsiella pneumoniae subsp. pneumoniae]
MPGARRWLLLRWGVVLLNCSRVVWQLREWETRSDPRPVRDLVHQPVTRCDERARRAAASVGLHPAGAAADLTATP